MEIVGTIDGYDVIYVPEKDVLFCKNTAVKVPVLERILYSGMQKARIDEKNLDIYKSDGMVTLGCLTTTMSNCDTINNNVKKLKVKAWQRKLKPLE